MADASLEKLEHENGENTSEDSATDPEAFNDGQLYYGGRDAEEIPSHLISDYSKVTRHLDLSSNRLRSLKGLEAFVNLENLVLDNNCLGDDITIPLLQQLHTLSLNKNQITNLDQLLDRLQSQLPRLTYLSLLGNLACPNQLSSLDKDDEDYQRYRYYVLFRLPKLKFLDSRQVTTKELAEAKRVGPFMKVVRAHSSDNLVQSSEGIPDNITPYTPLPDSHVAEEPRGTFSKSKYVYYGRHSEGNRFIRNNDL